MDHSSRTSPLCGSIALTTVKLAANPRTRILAGPCGGHQSNWRPIGEKESSKENVRMMPTSTRKSLFLPISGTVESCETQTPRELSSYASPVTIEPSSVETPRKPRNVPNAKRSTHPHSDQSSTRLKLGGPACCPERKPKPSPGTVTAREALWQCVVERAKSVRGRVCRRDHLSAAIGDLDHSRGPPLRRRSWHAPAYRE